MQLRVTRVAVGVHQATLRLGSMDVGANVGGSPQQGFAMSKLGGSSSLPLKTLVSYITTGIS
jgi:hypothetical protein